MNIVKLNQFNMQKVPKNLQNDGLSDYLNKKKDDYPLMIQGEVHDTYFMGDSLLLVVASDRTNINGFVLNTLVPHKGAIDTALTHFWLTKVLIRTLKNNLISSEICPGANGAYDLKKNLLPELSIDRCLLVRNLMNKVYSFDMVIRHHIGDSIFEEYQKKGTACGKWSKLNKPIFTPSTKKGGNGHDENVSVDNFFRLMETEPNDNWEEAFEIMGKLKEAYSIAYEFAEEKGILILDTKAKVAGLTIVDEFMTLNSSTFAFKEKWVKAMKEKCNPEFIDEPIKEWGRSIKTPFYYEGSGKQIIGIENLDSENPEHVEFVHSELVPVERIQAVSTNNLKIFEMITGVSLKYYQKESMGV